VGRMALWSVKEFKSMHRGHTREYHGLFLRAESKVGKWLMVVNGAPSIYIGPGRLCQHNFEHNRLSILVRIMLE